MKSYVSIIIPTYNRAKFLMDALESVRQQTLPPLEIIVVDDGSSDDTRKVLSESGFKVNYIYQKNRGPAAARNAGIAVARGNVIAFLDDDDLLVPNALELCVGHLERKAAFGVDVVLGIVRSVENVKRAQVGFTYKKKLPVLSDRILFCGVFKRNVFEKVGLFDQTLILNEDTDWFLRAREKNICFSLIRGSVTHLHRMHKGNISRDKLGAKSFLLKAIKKSLARREKAGDGFASPLADLSDFLY
ncbi:MAG: glycosyltransferase family 2 protein [Candidatus Levybacteria bacterium]|nr:glycosyltransferase family 2 protein [Candidatus Levybacteria bacterium]